MQPALRVAEFVREDGPRGRDERGCDQGGRDDVLQVLSGVPVE